MHGMKEKGSYGLNKEVFVELEKVKGDMVYEESLVRRWVEQIEICEKDCIKILFKD